LLCENYVIVHIQRTVCICSSACTVYGHVDLVAGGSMEIIPLHCVQKKHPLMF